MLNTQLLDRPSLVLIIDDDPQIISVYQEFLSEKNHRVLSASTGTEGLRIASKEKPKVLLLDVGLPDMSGFEVCEKMKADPYLCNVPIILVTGMGDRESQIKGLDCGANDFLRKPVDLNVLYARVRASIKYMHALEELQAIMDELEQRVQERTHELRQANAQLEEGIQERRRVEEALRISEERYALAARGANDGLWDWNMENGDVYFSGRWLEMAGYQEGELAGHMDSWYEMIHPDDLELFKSDLITHIRGHSPNFEVEYRIHQKDGTQRWMRCRGLAVRNAENEATRMAGSQTDITEEKSRQDQILHNAFHDELTGLPNRTLFLDRLGHTVRRVDKQPDENFAVLYLGIERFNLIVESMGFQAGDRLLSKISERLKKAIRPGDTLARIEGDEFAVIMEGLPNLGYAKQEAERLKIDLLPPFKLDERDVFVSAGTGIIMRPQVRKTPEEILRNARTAMGRALSEGMAGQQVYSSGLHQAVVSELELETELRQAVERNEFLLHYQPIVSIAENRVIGFEALMRWESPSRGLVSPMKFIPLAEETGLIVPMTWWCMEEASRQAVTWNQGIASASPIYISVNLSSKIFAQPDLIDRTKALLNGSAHTHLKMEITESAVLEHEDRVTKTLDALKKLGVEMLLDDFGTGYSSLSYLHRLPIDYLKIDRSFVGQMGPSGKNFELVRSIVNMAHSLEMKVVAEGVETDDQLKQLSDLKCEFAQGYLLAKPMKEADASAWLEKGLQLTA